MIYISVLIWIQYTLFAFLLALFDFLLFCCICNDIQNIECAFSIIHDSRLFNIMSNYNKNIHILQYNHSKKVLVHLVIEAADLIWQWELRLKMGLVLFDLLFYNMAQVNLLCSVKVFLLSFITSRIIPLGYDIKSLSFCIITLQVLIPSLESWLS